MRQHCGTVDSKHECYCARQQVGIYLRWAQRLLLTVLAGRPHVVVNMDDTGVSNVTSSKHGVIIGRGRNVPAESRGARRGRSSKITLLAVTCSSAGLQQHLPQVCCRATRRAEMHQQH